MRHHPGQQWPKTLRRWIVCGALAAGAAGCAALPAPADLDRVQALLDAPGTEALAETQPALVAESRFHAAEAEQARVRRDEEAARLHASIALQRLRTADNLDASGERRALWSAMHQREEGAVQVEGVGDAPAELAETPAPVLLDAPGVPAVGEEAVAPWSRAPASTVDDALHEAEDARAMVLTLVGNSDPRFAEGDALLDVARHAKADGYPTRALARAEEATLVFRVIRLTRGPTAGANTQAGAGGSQLTQADLKGRMARLDAQRLAIESLGNEAACPTQHGLATKLLGMARQSLTARDEAGAGAYLGEAERHEVACEAAIQAGLVEVAAKAKTADERAKAKLPKDPRWADVSSALQAVHKAVAERRLVVARAKLDAAATRAAELTLPPPGPARPSVAPGLEPAPVPDVLVVPAEEVPAAPVVEPAPEGEAAPPAEDPAAEPAPELPDEDAAAEPPPVLPAKDVVVEPKPVVPAKDEVVEPKPVVPSKDEVAEPKAVLPAKDAAVEAKPAYSAKDAAVEAKPAYSAKDASAKPQPAAKPAAPTAEKAASPTAVEPAAEPNPDAAPVPAPAPAPDKPAVAPAVAPAPVAVAPPAAPAVPAAAAAKTATGAVPKIGAGAPVILPIPVVVGGGGSAPAPAPAPAATPAAAPAPAPKAAGPKGAVVVPVVAEAPDSAVEAPAKKKAEPRAATFRVEITPVASPPPQPAPPVPGKAPPQITWNVAPVGPTPAPAAAPDDATPPTPPTVAAAAKPSPPPPPKPVVEPAPLAPKTLADLQALEKSARAEWRAATSTAVKAKAGARTVARREKSAARRVASLSKRFERSRGGVEKRAAQEDTARRELESLRAAATQRSADLATAQAAYPALLEAVRTAAGTPGEAAADSRRRDAARAITATERLVQKDQARIRRAERTLASRAAATERSRAVLRRDEVRLEAAVAEHQRLEEDAKTLPVAAESAAQESVAASVRYQAARAAVRERKQADRGRGPTQRK